MKHMLCNFHEKLFFVALLFKATRLQEKYLCHGVIFRENVGGDSLTAQNEDALLFLSVHKGSKRHIYEKRRSY